MALRRAITNLPCRRSVLRFCSSSSTSAFSGKDVDTVTHTGQVWNKDDYRRARFINQEKQVNPQFAIDLIAEDPVVVVNARYVWSDSGGALGHPKVYINLDQPKIGICGYSGRKFIQKKYYDEALHGPSISYEDYLEEMRPQSNL